MQRLMRLMVAVLISTALTYHPALATVCDNKESKQGRMADALALGGDEGRDHQLMNV